MHTVVLVL